MVAGAAINEASSALSALAWWRDAGFDTAIDEAPRHWLGEAAPMPATPQQIHAPAPQAMPATLAAFADWLAAIPELPDGSLPGRRLAAEGDPASGVMILIDMPEAADADAGRLLADESGRLLDRMLAAIGRDRASVYLAALCAARPIGGQLGADALPGLGRIATHHVALAAPRRLLLMGQAVSRALLGIELARARGRLHSVNHDGVTVEAVTTFAPRFLLQNPARKADAWRDLRLLIGGFES